MTAPNVPPVPSEVTEDLATKLVTEHLADGKIVTEPEATYLAEQVAEGHAHDTNEARVEIGLPQIPTLPASPDGAGNPTFTVGAVAPASGYTQTAGEQSVAPVILPIPHPAAAPEVHASFWASFWAFTKHALVATGHSLTNPAVLAVGAQLVAIKSPAAGAILTEVAQAEAAVQAPSAAP